MIDSNRPQVSICIPLYNCEEYVEEAIRSVLGQTFADWELIILDNSSTDKSLEVVRSIKDKRIRILESDRNRGIEANWNRALAEAKGDYIKLLPADDYLLPSCLEEQVKAFQQIGNETVVLVSSARNVIDASGKFLIRRSFTSETGLMKGTEAIRKIAIAGTNLLGEPAAILFKREIIQKVGQFDGSLIYVIDVDLWSRMLLLGDLYVISESLCTFRLSAGSCSIDVSSFQSKQFSAFLVKLSHNPLAGINWFHRFRGIIMSNLLSLGRRLFYIMTIRKVTR